jgi:hypothetical protein
MLQTDCHGSACTGGCPQAAKAARNAAATELFDSAPEWFYLDPQKNKQGPFGSTEMNQWFGGGFFQV